MAQVIDEAFARDFLARLHDAVNAHDAAAVAALCKDVIWDDPAAPTPLRGREAVRQFHAETSVQKVSASEGPSPRPMISRPARAEGPRPRRRQAGDHGRPHRSQGGDRARLRGDLAEAPRPLDPERARPRAEGPAHRRRRRDPPGLHPARRDSAGQTWRHVADQLRPRWPKLATLMDDSEADVLAYMSFPGQRRTKLHSTNPLVECAPAAGQDQAAVLTGVRALRSSNWMGLR
jgi:hypothetical protein